jgi:hypothetical protein
MAAFNEKAYLAKRNHSFLIEYVYAWGKKFVRREATISQHNRKRSLLRKPFKLRSPTLNFEKGSLLLLKGKMLRRKPTSISLTAEDLASYEDRQAREALLQAQLQVQAQLTAQQTQAQPSRGAVVTPQRSQNNDPKLTEDLREKRVKTREERLGLGAGPGLAGRG